MKTFRFVILLIAAISSASLAQEPGRSLLDNDLRNKLASELESLLALYRQLHAAPELSFQEEKTSIKLAGEMRAEGFEVTEKVGGWGVVAVLRNGKGKTILVRTDMDALPVREITGLPYASKVRTRDDQGRDVHVMHACGHDLHMACWVGAARMLASMKEKWRGTLVFIAQPAEERGAGAEAMLNDRLYERFPKPDICLALHNDAELPAGTLAVTEGPMTANVDTIDILVRGIGGHGAMPEKTKDPIVLAAQLITALQTIASREVTPGNPVVVTVGSIHGGTKHNIIPDEVRLQLTVRTTSAETREKVLASISRLARGQALAAGIPENLLPEMKVGAFIPVLFNDHSLSRQLSTRFTQLVGKENFRDRKPMMGGEDFSRFGMTQDKIPLCMFWLGATSAEAMREAAKSGEPQPGLHSPFYSPDVATAIPVGVTAMTAAVLELLVPPQGERSP